MTFGAPWMLLGALAALIPLLVHLFDRRRPRQHPFAAISFVLKSQKRTASRLKLKRLLLYALRTLILLAIPIALARPMWKQDAAAAAASKRGPAATSIILDTSMSMRFQPDRGESHFDRARDEARDALAGLMAEEPANLVICGPQAQPPGPPGFDRGTLRSRIDSAQVTFGSADLQRCLELAAASLEESPLPAKRIVLVSDLMAHGLRSDAPVPTVKGPDGQPVRPEIVLTDVTEAGDQRALPNRAIVSLKIEPALQVGPRAFQFTFTVRNFGGEAARDVEASLKIGTSVVAKSFLEIPGGGTAQKSLSYRFDAGGTFAGELRLSADGLEADDVWPFVIQVPRPLEALVINGAPSSQRYRDEVFFLEPALIAPGSPVQTSVRDPEAGLREDFSKYDVVLLANVAAPDAETVQRLKTFVEGGGGLFIALGDRTNAEEYNSRLGTLLPRPLRDVKTWAERDAEEGGSIQRPGKIKEIDTNHPLLSPFVGEAGEGLLSARFWKHMLLEAEGGRPESKIIATLEDGTPALVISREGKGRVALFTSTIDRDWSDFSIRTGFLPLMQRIAAYLAGALEEREELRARVGESLTLRPPPGVKVASIEGPDGKEPRVEAQEDGSLSVGPFAIPGTFSVKDSAGKTVPALAFSVVLDAQESDLTRAAPEALAAEFGEETVQTASARGEAPEVPLWTWLIAAAAMAFFAEGLLLRKT